MRQALHRDEDVLTPVAVGRKETTVLKKGTAKRPETQAGASVQKPRTRHPGTGASEHTAQSQEVLSVRKPLARRGGGGELVGQVPQGLACRGENWVVSEWR